jgi:hypothetical protein
MMRLTTLAPHWVRPPAWVGEIPFFVGVSFLCPHCEHTPCPTCGAQRGKRLAVSFWPPIDPDNWESRVTEIPHANFHRRISGETFDTLTLDPSIGLEPHWHGTIINGEVMP